MTESVFEDNERFGNAVNELFCELIKKTDPNEIREIFRIYREVMKNIASVGLDQAMHITYLSDEDREALAKVLFDDGYGKALHKLMLYASRLYSDIADAVYGSVIDDEKYSETLTQKAEETKIRADAFEKLLTVYNPEEGDHGKLVKTSSIDFGGFIEHMDQVFNYVYMHVDIDANADTVNKN
jgi:hypothetical protein